MKMEGFLHPKKLTQSVLPTRRDALEFYLFVKRDEKQSRNIYYSCATAIQNIWESKKLHTVTTNRISRKLKDVVNECQRILKYPRKKLSLFINKCEDFKFRSFALFAISKSRV